MNRKTSMVSLKFVTIFLMLFNSSSCKDTKKSGYVVFTPNALKIPYSLFPAQNRSGIRVSGNKDTANWSSESKLYSDTISYCAGPCYIYQDKAIPIKTLETFLFENNLGDGHLREHIYWMSLLTKAKLVEAKNKFGDSQGYYAIAGSIYIPPDYFFVDKLFNKARNKQFMLGKKHVGSSLIKYVIEVKEHNYNPNFEKGTPLELDNSQLKLLGKGETIEFYAIVEVACLRGIFRSGNLQNAYESGWIIPYDYQIITDK